MTGLVGDVLLAVAATLLGSTITVVTTRSVDSLRAAVGDLIAFDPAAYPPQDMRRQIIAPRTDHRARPLDVAVMHRYGGSLIVERRQADNSMVYWVHWAGASSAASLDACGGTAADLVSNSSNWRWRPEDGASFGLAPLLGSW